jgi:peptidoglycan/xylan/chitin deacetylase (PgdA/CDA1 family)
VVAHLKSHTPFTQPSIVLTIDDGYLCNYNLAYPLIRQHKIPALIYLTAGLIGTQRMPWIDKIEFILLHSQVESFSLPELFGPAIIDISSLRKKMDAKNKLFNSMLHLNPEINSG